MRYLAKCDGPLRELNQLRAPMASVLDHFVQQKKDLERYRAIYGDLPSSDELAAVQKLEDGDDEDSEQDSEQDSDEDSETESD
jgi:hypothetical protein